MKRLLKTFGLFVALVLAVAFFPFALIGTFGEIVQRFVAVFLFAGWIASLLYACYRIVGEDQ